MRRGAGHAGARVGVGAVRQVVRAGAVVGTAAAGPTVLLRKELVYTIPLLARGARALRAAAVVRCGAQNTTALVSHAASRQVLVTAARVSS